MLIVAKEVILNQPNKKGLTVRRYEYDIRHKNGYLMHNTTINERCDCDSNRVRSHRFLKDTGRHRDGSSVLPYRANSFLI